MGAGISLVGSATTGALVDDGRIICLIVTAKGKLFNRNFILLTMLVGSLVIIVSIIDKLNIGGKLNVAQQSS